MVEALYHLYAYYLVILCIFSIGSRALRSYEPVPEKMSLAEYEAEYKRTEALKSDFRDSHIDLYSDEEKIDSEAKYEVTEASYEPVESEALTATVTDASSGDMTYLGCYDLTAYMWTGNPCADGVYPSCGYTVACNDPNLWHRWIYIEGYGTYYVHDTGGMPSYNIIDVYLGDYDSCIQFGRRSANVYLIN